MVLILNKYPYFLYFMESHYLIIFLALWSVKNQVSRLITKGPPQNNIAQGPPLSYGRHWSWDFNSSKRLSDSLLGGGAVSTYIGTTLVKLQCWKQCCIVTLDTLFHAIFNHCIALSTETLSSLQYSTDINNLLTGWWRKWTLSDCIIPWSQGCNFEVVFGGKTW